MIRTAQLAAALLLLTACGRSTESYFPLTKGWQWLYDINVTTMDGPQHRRFLVENIGATKHDGERLQVRASADGTFSVYRAGANGVQRLGEAQTEAATVFYDTPVTVLPANIEVGAEWTATEYTFTLEHTGPPEYSLNRITVPVDVHYTIEAMNESVIVPAGTFSNCIRVKGVAATSKDVGFYVGHTDIRVENTLWYALGVGLVKSSRLETTSSAVLPRGSAEMQLTALTRR